MNINNWQTKRLGDLYDITSSKRVFQSEWKSSGVPFYRAREIVKLSQNGYVDNELFISEEMFNKYSFKYGAPKEGDLMVTGVGTLGIPYIVKKDDRFYFKDGNIIWLKRKSDINSKFVEYAFKSDFLRKQIDNFTGVTVGTYTIIKAKNTVLSVPSLSEQHRIVRILDGVFEKIVKVKENTEKNLQNSRALFEAYLQSVFANPGKDWEEKRLGEILEKTETINPRNNPDKGFIYIDVSSVNKENLTIENTTLIKGRNAPSRARKLIRIDDVIFATVRPTLRRIAIIPKEFDQQVCSTGYFVLRAKGNLINKLLFYFIQTKSFNEKMEKLQKGASYPAVTDGDVKNQIISFPKSITEQKTVVKKLDSLSEQTKKLQEIYKQKLTDLEKLKKSILNEAFSDRL